jgi:hypothetical protein
LEVTHQFSQGVSHSQQIALRHSRRLFENDLWLGDFKAEPDLWRFGCFALTLANNLGDFDQS